MVEVRDVTEEKIEEKKRTELEKKLAEECFPKEDIRIIGDSILIISDRFGLNSSALKYIGTTMMYVYDKNIFSQAHRFAREYEEQFGVKNFVIKTDYSRNN